MAKNIFFLAKLLDIILPSNDIRQAAKLCFETIGTVFVSVSIFIFYIFIFYIFYIVQIETQHRWQAIEATPHDYLSVRNNDIPRNSKQYTKN